MQAETNTYHAYMLRIWRSMCQGKWQWRANLENAHTGERMAFASLAQCFTFLDEQCRCQEPESTEEELNHSQSIV